MFNKFFEILTIASDISEFVSLKKTFDNHEQLQIIQKLDKLDDEVFNILIFNQNIIINLLKEAIMHIKKMMDKIIEKNNKEDMNVLGNMFVDMVYDLKDKEPMAFKEIEYKMHKLAYGEHLTQEQAECWTAKMENKDGTIGEHWTYEQTENVRKQYAPDLNPCDFYAVLNSVYSDYYSSKFDTSSYVQLAIDFIGDKDAQKGKVLKYYIFIA